MNWGLVAQIGAAGNYFVPEPLPPHCPEAGLEYQRELLRRVKRDGRERG